MHASKTLLLIHVFRPAHAHYKLKSYDVIRTYDITSLLFNEDSF